MPRFCETPVVQPTRNIQHRGRSTGGETGVCLGFPQRGGAAVQPAAALKTRVRVLFREQAEEDYEEDMRHPADGRAA